MSFPASAASTASWSKIFRSRARPCRAAAVERLLSTGKKSNLCQNKGENAHLMGIFLKNGYKML